VNRCREGGLSRDALHLHRADLYGGQKHVLGEVRTPHGALVIGMTKNAADGQQIDARVDQEPCTGMTQVVKPETRQLRLISCRQPAAFQASMIVRTAET